MSLHHGSNDTGILHRKGTPIQDFLPGANSLSPCSLFLRKLQRPVLQHFLMTLTCLGLGDIAQYDVE